MYSLPGYEFVWYFFIIRFKLCIWGRNIPRSDTVDFSVPPIRKHVLSTGPVPDVNFGHIIKVKSFSMKGKIINILWGSTLRLHIPFLIKLLLINFSIH